VSLRFFVCLLTLFALSACGKYHHEEIEPVDLSGIKKVGVISQLDDTFEMRHYGLTIFTNEGYTTNVAEWRVNDYIKQFAKTDLQRAGYQVSLLDGEYSEYNDYTGLDAVVVFLEGRNRTGSHLPNWLHRYGSLGFNHHWQINNIYASPVAAIYKVNFDGRAGQTIGWFSRSEAHCRDVGDLERIPWKESWVAYTKQEKDYIEQIIKKCLKDDIAVGFKEVGFTK